MLINLLPDFFKQSNEMVDIQNAIEVVYSDFDEAQKDLESQLFIETATWCLPLWEKFLGLPIAFEKPIEERRSKIKSRLRGYGTSTKELIKNIALSFNNGDLEVTEDNPNYTVSIEFVSALGVPSNIDDLKAAVKVVIPAHLEVTYIFKYRRWSEFAAKTWAEVANYTWAQAKELEVI